jgi:hypothetical protein
MMMEGGDSLINLGDYRGAVQDGERDSWLEAGFGVERLVGTTEVARLRGAAECNTTRGKSVN